jgi:hypothetical protein
MRSLEVDIKISRFNFSPKFGLEMLTKARGADALSRRVKARSLTHSTPFKTQRLPCPSRHDHSMTGTSPQIPTSFDPAIFLHSEAEFTPDILASASFSEDLEALQQCAAEDRAQKNGQGIVIQHRAWRIGDTFRSEEDYQIGTRYIVWLYQSLEAGHEHLDTVLRGKT